MYAAEDLSEEDEAEIKELCIDIFKTNPPASLVYSKLAERIRERCDKEKGKGWNCIVGKSFGAFVT